MEEKKYSPFEEGVITINSIDIPLYHMSRDDELKILNFPVYSQSGDVISVIISPKDIGIFQSLIKEDNKINEIRFYSDTSLFIGTGIVRSVSRIKSGPEKGNYLIEMQIK